MGAWQSELSVKAGACTPRSCVQLLHWQPQWQPPRQRQRQRQQCDTVPQLQSGFNQLTIPLIILLPPSIWLLPPLLLLPDAVARATRGRQDLCAAQRGAVPGAGPPRIKWLAPLSSSDLMYQGCGLSVAVRAGGCGVRVEDAARRRCWGSHGYVGMQLRVAESRLLQQHVQW